MKFSRNCMVTFLMLSLILFFTTAVPAVADDPEKDPMKSNKPETLQLDDVVVSATRSETKKEEVPSVMEVITPLDLKTSVDSNITRILKKNSSVDVIDYPGVLSGISIRGFRPETSGITKRSLILIDGRPAGAENIASILKDNVERIEVLKGPASALYGAEAMGGVVNIITKKSRGEIVTDLTLGGGSFNTFYQRIASGGSISQKLDYDISMGNRVQNADFTMGNGEKRPNTSYKEMNGALRIGSSLSDILRADIKADWYGGRDIRTPNALHYEDKRPSEKNIDRWDGDINLRASWANNETRLTLYASNEEYDTTRKWKGEVPFLSFDKKTDWLGAQLSNTYRLFNHDITAGLDYQNIDVETRSYNSDGTRKAPSSPDNGRDNFGVYADGFLRFFNDRLILNTGARYDRFDIETKTTPYKTDFTAGTESFDIINPRAGVKYFIDQNRMFQFHATIGTAFVPPDALQMAGYAETELTDGTIMYLRGNPDIDPEKSTTWDSGFTFHNRRIGFYFDVTYFHTDVKDKITTRYVSPTERTYFNAFEAKMRGVEWELTEDIGMLLNWNRILEFYVGGTYLIKSEEEVDNNQWQDIYNVSRTKFNTGLMYDDDRFFGKFNVRYMGKRKDNDWYTRGYPEITYDSFTVCDLSAGLSFMNNHKIQVNIDNIFDEYYYEKPEYPLPGRSIFAEYTFTF